MKLPIGTKITADMIEQAITKARISRIEHHDCSFCHYPCAYIIKGGRLLFDAGCGCTGRYIRRPVPWDEIADWINMQTVPKWTVELAKRCGIEIVEEETNDEETEQPDQIKTAWGIRIPGA